MKLLVAASNELPTQGEGLEALWDRFLIRIISTCVKQEEAFYQMLLDDGDEEEQEACRWQISDEEYAGWQKEIRQIKVSAEVLSCITEYIAIIAMPFAYSISEGISFGVITYVILNVLTGHKNKISGLMYILAVLFVLKYVLL